MVRQRENKFIIRISGFKYTMKLLIFKSLVDLISVVEILVFYLLGFIY